MDDKFVMSVGLAHELQHAFNRCGWNAAQVKSLTDGDFLEHLRVGGMFLTPSLDQNVYDFFQENQRHADISWGRLAAISSILRDNHVIKVRQLVQMSEGEFIRTPNLGSKGFKACNSMLARHGLHFEMKFD